MPENSSGTTEEAQRASRFSVIGSYTLLPDLDPIIDDGAPHSTGGIDHATILCDAPRTKLQLVRGNAAAGTGFNEVFTVNNRSMRTLIAFLEGGWIHRHGAPKAISADEEHNRKAMRISLHAHNIIMKPRPARRHNKLGIVERENGVIKTFIMKLEI